MPATLVLEGAQLVVLEPEPHLEADQSVVTHDDRIVWVGPREELPVLEGAEVIDVAGAYVMAGLSDMHAHLPAEQDEPFGLQTYLELQLAAGVTSIRSMRGDPSHQAVRAAIRAGDRVGPDVMVASTPIAVESLSIDEAKQAVDQAKHHGASFIKLLGVGDLASYRNLMEAATKAGLPVAGHLPQSVPSDVAIALGQQSIEHLGGVLEAVRDDPSTVGRVASALAQPKLFHCPTLHWYALGLGVYPTEAFEDEPALDVVSKATRAQWDTAFADRRAKLNTPTTGRVLEPMADRFLALRHLHEAGAALVIGPDSGGAYGLPGSAVHDEMQLFVDAGIPLADTLRAATINAAALRGATDEGRVAKGYVADLVVCAQNPLIDIDHMSDVVMTVHRGHVFVPQTASTHPKIVLIGQPQLLNALSLTVNEDIPSSRFVQGAK